MSRKLPQTIHSFVAMFKVKLPDGTFVTFASYETALAISARLKASRKPSKYSPRRRRDDERHPLGMIVWDHAAN